MDDLVWGPFVNRCLVSFSALYNTHTRTQAVFYSKSASKHARGPATPTTGHITPAKGGGSLGEILLGLSDDMAVRSSFVMSAPVRVVDVGGFC